MGEEHHEAARDRQVLAEMDDLLRIPEVGVEEERRHHGEAAKAESRNAGQKSEGDRQAAAEFGDDGQG
jgi:hypothetical protein